MDVDEERPLRRGCGAWKWDASAPLSASGVRRERGDDCDEEGCDAVGVAMPTLDAGSIDPNMDAFFRCGCGRDVGVDAADELLEGVAEGSCAISVMRSEMASISSGGGSRRREEDMGTGHVYT